MPRKNKAEYRKYMKEYMAVKRSGLTGINKNLVVGGSGLEPLTPAMSTQYSKPLS